MTTRDERFLSEGGFLRGTITRFEVVRYELRDDQKAITITVAVHWVLTEPPDKKSAESTTWVVNIHGRSRDGRITLLAAADSSAATVHHERTAAGSELRFELRMVIALRADMPSPSFEATIRPHERFILRSPSGEVLGYTENPDVDSLVEKRSPEVVKWLRGELNSLRILFESMRDEGRGAPSSRLRQSAPLSLTDARFAVYAPSHVERGTQFVLEVWAFAPELDALVAQEATKQGRRQLLGSKGPVAVTIGKTLAVSVAIPGFHVDPAIDAVVWDGTKANTSFVLFASRDAAIGSHVGSATVSSGALPVAVVRFELVVAEKELEVRRHLTDEQIRIHSLFASYASDDRIDVLQWARGAEVAGLEVFLDVLALREGSAWEMELVRQVPAKDLFCLFWSAAASRSKWVDMEWRCALAARGLDYIHPVPLADPRVVPPPDELRSKLFSGVSFIVRQYEKQIGGTSSSQTSS